jgi:dipeptidyl-peptidase-4
MAQKKQALAAEVGTNSELLVISSIFINTLSATQPTTYTLKDAKTGKQLWVIEDNSALAG